MIRLILVLVLCNILNPVAGQHTRFIVRLKDKSGTAFSLNSPTSFLSPRALERRAKYHLQVDSTDLPVSAVYLDSIRAVPNVTILNVSKWLNQVCIRTTDPDALMKITSFPFVMQAAPIGSVIQPGTRTPLKKSLGNAAPVQVDSMMTPVDASYGLSFPQINIHDGQYLHESGFKGQGMIIAVLDGGFYGYKTNRAFDSMRLNNQVLDEWDFVANQASVNEDHEHGMYCLSIMTANLPGSLVGSAPKAAVLLYRTEDVYSEYPVEEQNWAAAAERADSIGADMISSSLGYVDFDDPAFNHAYAQRDGNTALVTKAADLAARKGMIVMNSAGNSGGYTNEAKFIACPADGDSVMAVGATDVNGNIAWFSSWGPNSAGKVKPNVVSVGQGCAFANTAGNPVTGDGTSFSNPNLAGLVACLWQAYPEFSNMEILRAVEQSADRIASPDVRYGYGIPDMRKAAFLLDQKRTAASFETILKTDWIKAYPVPFDRDFQVIFRAPATASAALRLMDAWGRTIEVKQLDVVQNGYYTVRFNSRGSLPAGMYLVQYADGSRKTTIRIVK